MKAPATPAVKSDAALHADIREWLARPARADIRGLPAVNVPALAKLRQLVPEEGAQKTLAAAYRAALRVSQPASVLRRSHAASLTVLRQRPLGECDAQAQRVSRDSSWLAGGAGAALGVSGAVGLVADAPALVMVALRAIVRIGYCYGETASPALVAALFALASADTDEEKTLAWQAVLDAPEAGLSEPGVTDAAIRDGLERAAEREFAKQALTGSLQKLITTLVQRLGVRRAGALLPVVGAVVGGAVNLRFVFLLSEAARMGYAARRLARDGIAVEKLARTAAIDVAPRSAKKATRLAPRRRKPRVNA